jgi:methoxymalonate biosynthesis acyl carrier protein
VTASDISQRVARIVRSLLGPEDSQPSVDPEFVLDGSGQLDSVWALQLVVALEKEFGISVEDIDVTPENFQNISSLTRFVARKIERVTEAS